MTASANFGQERKKTNETKILGIFWDKFIKDIF